MKTTLNLNEEILKKAKSRAAENGITLTRFVEEALQAKLITAEGETGYKYRPVVVRGTAPPNVDIEDRDALYDFMDEWEWDEK